MHSQNRDHWDLTEFITWWCFNCSLSTMKLLISGKSAIMWESLGHTDGHQCWEKPPSWRRRPFWLVNTEDYSKNSCRSESLSMRRIWRGHGKRRSIGPKNVQEKEMKSLTNFTKQVWGSVDLYWGYCWAMTGALWRTPWTCLPFRRQCQNSLVFFSPSTLASSMLHENLIIGSRGCVPSIGDSHLSASLDKAMPGF